MGLGAVALTLCGYRMGDGDQAQYLAHLIALREPGAFAGDPYLEAFGALLSAFWWPLSHVGERWWGLAFLFVAWLSAAASAWLLIVIGKSLLERASPGGQDWRWACLAFPLAFVTQKEGNWFGLVGLADMELTATSAVLPLVFASLLLWIRGRAIASFACAVIALPVHGQTGAFLLAAWWWALALGGPRGRGWTALLSATGVIGAAAILVTRQAWSLPGEVVDRYRATGAELYEPLIDPLTATPSAWAGVALLLVVGAAASGSLAGQRRTSGANDAALRRLRCWTAGACVLPTGSLILHALPLQEPVLWKLMTGRAFMLPSIGAIVLTVLWSVTLLAHSSRAARAAGAGTLLVLALWPMHAEHPVITGASGLLLAISVAVGVWRTLIPRGRDKWRAPWTLRMTVVGATLGVAFAGAWAGATRTSPWTVSAALPDWLDAQRWARDHTSPTARFITPPYRSGWRVGSHRATYGELLDGGLLFYSGAPVLEWRDRMINLGMPSGSWSHLEASERETMATRYHRAINRPVLPAAEFLVTERAHDPSPTRIVFENSTFLIRQLETDGQNPAPRRRGQ